MVLTLIFPYVYMLGCAKYRFRLSVDFVAQSSDLSFVQNSKDIGSYLVLSATVVLPAQSAWILDRAHVHAQG